MSEKFAFALAGLLNVNVLGSDVIKSSRHIMSLQEHNSIYLHQTDTKRVARTSRFNNTNVNTFYDNMVEIGRCDGMEMNMKNTEY
jgi:hypothetical protein